MGHRAMDRDMGRKSEAHATTLVTHRASRSRNEPTRTFSEASSFVFGWMGRFERRVSRAARASSAVRGTPPNGMTSSADASRLAARLAADARNPKGRKPPGAIGESAPSRCA